MIQLARLLGDPVVLRFGLALLHFLWQGAALALLAALLLRLLARARPAVRYLALLAVLVAMAASPAVTFLVLPRPPQPGPVRAVAMARPLPVSTPAAATESPASAPTVKAPSPVPRRTPLLRALQGRLSGPWRWVKQQAPRVVLAWVVGVCLLSGRLFWRWLAAVRGRRRATPILEERWERTMALLTRRLRVSPAVELLESALVHAPAVVGWLRPAILLPASLLTGLTADQLEALLVHELAHIRRRDYLVNLGENVLETLLFYHPAVWWVSHRVRVEREHCCDDVAVQTCGSVVTYARALAEVERLRPPALQLAVAAGGTPPLDRLRRLVGVPREAGRGASWLASAVPVATVAALLLNPPVPIEGRLVILVHYGGQAYYLSGDSSHRTYVPLNVSGDLDLSPDGTRYAYSRDGLHVCRADGTGDRVIGPPACAPRWSPDGKRIVFTTYVGGVPEVPGCPGGQIFVVNADGSGLTQVTHVPGPHTPGNWSPDGRWLTWLWRRPSAFPIPMVGTADGREAHALVGPELPLDNADGPVWSPDGRRVLLDWQMSDPDRPGSALAILGTVAPDGSDPQPILQYPLPKHLSWYQGPEGYAGWMEPCGMAWSPDGARVTFLSAFHMLPEAGSPKDRQSYVVNVDGTHLRRLTYDPTHDTIPTCWRGPNTSPARREITVNNVTLTFSAVAGEGLTTIIWDGAPPALPPRYRPVGDCYDLNTTAPYSGPVTIAMEYDPAQLPPGAEARLALLRWNGNVWQDITTSRDPARHLLRGRTDSLARVTLALPPRA